MNKTKTKEEYIELIRKACILADKSIVDLVEGCVLVVIWVVDLDTPETLIWTERTGIKETNPRNGKRYINENNISGEIKEIIGRKIGVAEILVAVEDKDRRFFEHTHLIGNGKMCLKTGKDIYWDLKNDDIENQTLETLEWVANLLDKE